MKETYQPHEVARREEDPTRTQVRGSSMLLGGRMVALGINLLAQLILVRYFSRDDYGAWTYALAVVAVLGTMASLGLDRTVTRFTAIYSEQKDYSRLAGAMILALATLAVVGTLLVCVFYIFPEHVAGMVNDAGPIGLLMILIVLVPLESLDILLLGVCASLGGAKAIFVRRYLAGPTLRLLAVLMLSAMHATATALAIGYVAASVAGVVLCIGLLLSTLKANGLLRELLHCKVRLPAREMFGFTLPLMTTDFVTTLMQSSGALILGFFCTMDQVALYTIVLPLAALNLTVYRVFGTLYTPTASRLFVRGDSERMVDLYWRTAAWLTVLTFPVFALTFCMAKPLTVFLFGEPYARSGAFLALLAIGQYFNIASGFNGLTLRVMGKVRFVVWINLFAALGNLGLTLYLVRRMGPLGAAVSASSSLILHSCIRQLGLRFAAGIPLFDWSYFGLYAKVAGAAIALVIATRFFERHILILAALAMAASVAVLLLTRRSLRIADTFPELLRVPVLRMILT